jgi:8-hydroxy-5-deazaflavin:NADPH oxidoreductase
MPIVNGLIINHLIMNIGIIGAGYMGVLLARKLIEAGYGVQLSGKSGAEALETVIQELGGEASAVSVAEVTNNKVVILAVKWEQVESALAGLGPALKDRIVIDATNPVTNDGTVIMEKGFNASKTVAALIPGARIVKAFNTLKGAWIEEGPFVGGGRRVVFLSGDDDGAKKVVEKIIGSMQFIPVDLGDLQMGGGVQQAGGPLAGLDFVLFPE